MASVRDFEELAIFQKARELSKKIYPITQRGEFKKTSALSNKFVQPQAPSWTTLLKDSRELATKNS